MATLVRRRNRGDQQEGQGGAVARRRPLDESNDLESQLGQLIQSVISGDPAAPIAAWVPMADVEETDDAWIIEAELPGASRADIEIELREGNELAITGEIKEKVREGILRRRTRRVGDFELRVRFPTPVHAEKAEASLEDGVLTVRVPKHEQASRRRVELQS